MEELSDHLQDITEENMSTEAKVCSRLGNPEQVAEAAATTYRRRSFLGQHPTAAFLVFAVSPVAIQFVFYFICLLAAKALVQFGFFGDPHGKFVMPSPFTLDAVSNVGSFIFIVFPAILATILYCKLAKRLGFGKKWMFVSSIVLALMSVLPCWYVCFHMDAAGHPIVRAAIAIPSPRDWYDNNCLLMLLIQISAPLAICWWFMRRKLTGTSYNQPLRSTSVAGSRN
jgi:hypothetical protein